mmetsp:Transcript_21540/g.59697  ORF Transcript_21540/g.59697 Transcript_21540/m.59697 type:complete len:461 (+) Transcript_21540:646-2028(+)
MGRTNAAPRASLILQASHGVAGLGLESHELLVQRCGGLDPDQHNGQQDGTQVRCGGGQGAEANNHELLDQGTTGLAQRVADHINGGLTLGLDLIIQGDVSHLLAGVEQAVLGRLAEDVLGSAHQHSGIQGGHAPACQHGASGLREHEQAEENQTGDKQQGGSDESSCTPAKLAEDDAGQKHHGEGHCTSGCAEVTHEAGVVVGVGELGLDLRLPGHLHQVDGNTVGHHQQCQITDVGGGCQEGKGLAHAHLGLALLLLLVTDLVLHLGHHLALQTPVDSQDDEATNNHHAHQTCQGHTPAINTRGQTGTHHGEVLHSLAGENESNVGSQTEQRIELGGLLHSGNLVGKAPEQHGHHHGTPQLSHHVEQAEGPVAQDGNGACPALANVLQQGLAEGSGVQDVAHGVQQAGKGAEEDDEGDDAGVEQGLAAQHVGQLGVTHGEANGHGQVYVGLQEGNDFRA